MQSFGPRAAAYALATLFALALAIDLLWMPIQVGDSLGEILDAQQAGSAWETFVEKFGTESYLRPLRIAQIKLLFDAAQSTGYWLAYRGFHAALIIAAVLLFVRALRVSSAVDFAAAAFGLVVLIGLQTFRGTVGEAFPINHFLEMVVCCLIALNLARSRGGLLVDAAAVIVFAAAALTLESGLLVWVVATAAWACGWRGISMRGLAVMTVLLAGYLSLRFFYLDTGVPTITERSSGYLLDILEPSEIQERFGAQPLWYYTYNILASIGSVLFSEPQSGVFDAIRTWRAEAPLSRVAIPVATSLATTAVMIWAAVRRVRNRTFDDAARLLVIFAAVLLANAALSFAYTKDEIVSIAGAFYALAAYGVVRGLLAATVDWRPAARAACAIALCMLAVGWTLRSVGVHVFLRSQAIKQQNDWVSLPYARQRSGDWPDDPAAAELILQLRREAIALAVPNTRVDEPEWPSRLWTDE
jgi:hypothetical protein